MKEKYCHNHLHGMPHRDGPEDVVDIVKRYLDGKNDTQLKEVAHNAQAFVSR